MEKEIEEERRKANERVNKLKEVVRMKEASALEARKQFDEVGVPLFHNCGSSKFQSYVIRSMLNSVYRTFLSTCPLNESD